VPSVVLGRASPAHRDTWVLLEAVELAAAERLIPCCLGTNSNDRKSICTDAGRGTAGADRHGRDTRVVAFANDAYKDPIYRRARIAL
jgi:hypothetical protein